MGTVYAKEVEVISPSPHTQRDSDMPSEKEVELKAVKVKVENIHIEGLVRTKNDIMVQQVKDIFAADNFQDMVVSSGEAKQKMEALGLFKSVTLYIDTSKGEDARADGYDLTFKVKEHRRFTGGISTLVGTNDGSIMLNLRMPNLFGRAERLNGEYSYGTKHAVGVGVNFTKPLQGNPNLILQTSAFQNSGEFPWSGYSEIGRGVNASLSFPTAIGSHTLSWEGVWREIGCLDNTVAFAVREQAGNSLKSALKHTWLLDTRDNKVIPQTGVMVKSTQELAGVGGDISYMKQDLELQANKMLYLDTVLQLSLAGGITRPIQPGSQLKLPDRFFLGGPLTLRGYNIRGCGPHSDGSSLGADTYWLAAAHIYTPLPFRRGAGGFSDLFRTHMFINAGNLTNVDLQSPWKTQLSVLAETLRWSYGAGIVFKLGGIARLEVNYCMPMRALATDSVNPGFQFGVGVHFL